MPLNTSDLADYLVESRMPGAAYEVRVLVDQMETAAAAALGIGVTKLKGREPLKRQLSRVQPRPDHTYPLYPVKPYLLRRGGPAAAWRSGNPAKKLTELCNDHGVDPVSGVPLRRQGKASTSCGTPQELPTLIHPAPLSIPHLSFGSYVPADQPTRQELKDYRELRATREKMAAEIAEQMRQSEPGNAAERRAIFERRKRAKIRRAEAVCNEKFLVNVNNKFDFEQFPCTGADPSVPKEPWYGCNREQGHGSEFLERPSSMQEQSVRRVAREMHRRNRGCQYEGKLWMP